MLFLALGRIQNKRKAIDSHKLFKEEKVMMSPWKILCEIISSRIKKTWYKGWF